MPSLPQVLNDAAGRGATEILLESGRAPVFRSSSGQGSTGDVWLESALYDALGQMLGPDQQAELAVGNVVEFQVDVDAGRWTMLTEPRPDGIVLRGRLLGKREAVERGMPMELPPLEPFSPAERDEVPRSPKPVFPDVAGRQTAWDLGIEPPPSPVFPGDTPAVLGLEPDLQDLDLDDLEASIDFEFRPAADGDPAAEPTSEVEAETQAEPPPAAKAGSGEPWPDNPTRADDDAGAVRSGLGRSPTARAARAVPTPRHTPVSASATDELAALTDFADGLQPGSLCLVQGVGEAERIASMLSGGTAIEVDDSDGEATMAAALWDDPGLTYVVSVEDPSRCLGWILRRLEEGARVLVRTRARTFAGARRSLLGLHDSVRAEAWLDEHALHFIGRENGRLVFLRR